MTGSIKTKTPKFKFIIPQFNIATWHDYIEDNFRAIDALFYNIFDIQNYKGSWTKTTEYKKDQVLFIPEDYEVDENGQFKTDEQGSLISSLYSGRMVKVLIDHTTNNSDYFSQFYYNHKNLYELFADASNSQVFAQRAENYAKTSKQYKDLAVQQAQISINAKQSCENEVKKAKQEVTNATNQANLSKQYADNAKTSENNAAISKNNAKTSETNATNQANLAQQYKNSAKDWAVSQNIVDNEDYSSKYWAGKSKKWAESVSSPVNKNLSNLNPQGQNIANWSTNITNCITEIPQDIKLELNNGTLTLKAGSKVYVPNGFESDGTTKKFDVITTEKDISYSTVYTAAVKCYAVYNYSAKTLIMIALADNRISYNSTTNKVIHTEIASVLSFPLALVVRDTTGIGSVDQVFNGFGYIGSTVFALPDVKGLIPNGRNTDGSLKNLLSINYSVHIYTLHSSETKENIPIYVQQNGSIFRVLNHIYDEKNNFNLNFGDINYCYVGPYVSYANGKITSFIPKTPFHVLDYNDKSTISGWSMPSSRYIDLTLGASGSTYKAPANGYFYLGKSHSSTGGIIDMQNITSKVRLQTSNVVAKDYMFLYLPARKNDIIKINYKADGTLQGFMFIYAEGEN